MPNHHQRPLTENQAATMRLSIARDQFAKVEPAASLHSQLGRRDGKRH